MDIKRVEKIQEMLDTLAEIINASDKQREIEYGFKYRQIAQLIVNRISSELHML